MLFETEEIIFFPASLCQCAQNCSSFQAPATLNKNISKVIMTPCFIC